MVHPVTKKEIFRFDGSVTRFGLSTKVAVERTVEAWIQKALQGDDPLATPKTVDEAVKTYLQEKENSFRGRMKEWHKGKSLSIRKYADVLNPLSGYLEKTHGLKYLTDVETGHLSNYLYSRPGRKTTDRATGETAQQPKSANSLQKEQENVRQFFKRCRQLRFITYDPAEALLPITVDDEGADPFTLEEKTAIIKAIRPTFPTIHKKVRAFVLLQMYTGSRISDAATAEICKLEDDGLWIKTKKSGETVEIYHELEPFVVKALRDLRDSDPSSEKYFFWTGNSTLKTLVSDWTGKLLDLFTAAKIPNHKRSHNFRDSLGSGVSTYGRTQDAQVALGHKRITTTERFYLKKSKKDFDDMNSAKRRFWDSERQQLGGKMIGEDEDEG